MITPIRILRPLTLRREPLSLFIYDGAHWLCQECAPREVFCRTHYASGRFASAIRAGACADVPKPVTCWECGLHYDVKTLSKEA